MIKGVYARNRLPGLLNVPSVLVGNTDPDHRTGQHWVAIYANSRGEYYDPTGTPPFLRAYVNFMNKYCTSWTYNTIRVQEEGSTVCGYHYIFFTSFIDVHDGVFNLCQHFEISYSRYANKHFITGVYITINDSYR